MEIDEVCGRMGAYDEKTGNFIDSGIDLQGLGRGGEPKFKKWRKGWHHIAVVCEEKNH